ncbi:unnamed protein product, partial [Pleuronectes platessa]
RAGSGSFRSESNGKGPDLQPHTRHAHSSRRLSSLLRARSGRGPLTLGCSSPIVVKFADTQKDKEQRRLQQQLAQQMQQLNSATTWGSLTGLGGLTPQYLALLQQATSSSNLGAFSGIQQMAEQQYTHDHTLLLLFASGRRAADSHLSGRPAPPGMSALQLQNLATLAAAAAAAQNSASPSNANPLSSNAASLAALTSPGNAAASRVARHRGWGGRGGPTPALRSPLSTVAITSVVAPL